MRTSDCLTSSALVRAAASAAAAPNSERISANSLVDTEAFDRSPFSSPLSLPLPLPLAGRAAAAAATSAALLSASTTEWAVAVHCAASNESFDSATGSKGGSSPALVPTAAAVVVVDAAMSGLTGLASHNAKSVAGA